MSAAIEALLVFQEVQPLAFGDIVDALKELQTTLAQASRSVVSFLQINGSFLNTFNVPWPTTLRNLLVVFGALNLDFVDPDAASRWLGRSVHYGTATLGLCFAFLFLLLARFLDTPRPSLALDLDLDLSPEPDSEPDPLPLPS